MSELLVLVSFVFGLLLGGAGIVVAFRSRMRTAESGAKQAAEGQLASAAAQLEHADSSLQELKAQIATLTESNSQLGEQFNAAHEKAIRLEERGSQVDHMREERDAMRASLQELEQAKAKAEKELAVAFRDLQTTKNQLAKAEAQTETLRQRQEELQTQHSKASSEIATLETTLEKEREQVREKLELLADTKASMTEQFKVLSSEILEEKSKRFSEQNKAQIGELLNPVQKKLKEFKDKVQETYEKGTQERSRLGQQVKQLHELNQQLSKDAHNLTTALKGSNKSQGVWGEMILERILEDSGLRNGHEYETQSSFDREDGSRARPDAIIHLPEARDLIVDAKVSLTAFERYSSSETEEQRIACAKEHLQSIKAHIKMLSDKNYHLLDGIGTLDCTLMFVAVEPAFALALTVEPDLFQTAWDRNIMLVSPSTLLFVLRTVAHIWRQESQTQNALEIAKRGAELYDKFANFIANLEDVGKKLRLASKSYDDAYKQLSTGRGNLVRQAEMLRNLGVKPTKTLPAHLLGQNEAEEAE